MTRQTASAVQRAAPVRRPVRRPARSRLLACALAAAFLLGCGEAGTELAGGVGSGGSGVAEGLVSGFGSVIVDGVAYDDSSAQVSIEDDAGRKQTTALALGQRVRLSLNEAGKASTIEVLPQMIGPVTATPQGPWLGVAGQWVRVDSDTVLLDHPGVDSIALGANIEVHGTWQTDDARGAVLMANMLRTRSAPADAPALVGGVVHALDGRTATLGSAQGTRVVLPPDAPLPGVGDVVAWWVARDTVLNAAGPGPWPALRQRQVPAPGEATTWVLSGAVRDVEGRRLSVQGFQFDWPEVAGALPPRRGDLVRMTLRRVNGRWEAERGEVRDEPSRLGGRVELRGRLAGVEWDNRPLELTLRGVRVALDDDVVASSGCTGTAPVNVEIVAARGPLPLRAIVLRCTPILPGP